MPKHAQSQRRDCREELRDRDDRLRKSGKYASGHENARHAGWRDMIRNPAPEIYDFDED